MEKAKKRFYFKSFASFSVAGFFILAVLSGVILYFAPQGRIAGAAGWDVLGLGRQPWMGLHLITGFLFAGFGIAHFLFNFRTFKCYFSRAGQRLIRYRFELVAAVAVITVVTAGTIFNIPPFSIVHEGHREAKSSWVEKVGKDTQNKPRKQNPRGSLSVIPKTINKEEQNA